MKFIVVLFFALYSAIANSSVTDLKLSTAQIFDVQWNISGGTLNASGFNYIYSSVNYATQTTSAARWTSAQTTDAGANGRYIGFFDSTTNPGTYGMAVFNSDGTKYKIINNTGSFKALANGAIFYNGNGMWGTLITTGQGYNYGQSGSWSVTQADPTNTQLQAYIPPSSTPLAAGQTAAPATPTYASSITQAQQARYNSAQNKLSTVLSNKVIIEQANDNNTVSVLQDGRRNQVSGIGQDAAIVNGNYNEITIRQGDLYAVGVNANLVEMRVSGDFNKLNLNQGRTSSGSSTGSDGGGHYQLIDVNGTSNTITTSQRNNGSGNHYLEANIIGSNNINSINQFDNTGKKAFTNINGNNNTMSIQQDGIGAHYVDATLMGNGNSANVTQSGSAAHRATILLTNAGGPSSLILNQTSNTSQVYSISQTCANANGCSVSVVQP